MMPHPDPESLPDDDPTGAAFDVLIAEAVTRESPPDLTPQILDRLNLDDGRSRSAIRVASRSRSQSRRRPAWHLIAIAGVVAAAVLLVVGGSLVRPNSNPSPDSSTAQAASDSTNGAGAVSLPSDPVEVALDDRRPRVRPPLPEPIEFPDSPSPGDLVETDRERRQNSENLEPAAPRTLQPVTLVSQNVDDRLSRYWSDVEVTPTPEATGQQWRDHWIEVLGIDQRQVPPTTGSDDPMQRAVAWTGNRAVQTALARQWMKTVFGRHWRSVTSDQQDAMTEEVSESFGGGASFPKIVSRWLQRPSHPLRSVGGQEASVHRVASLTLAVDLRCTGCHDGMVDRGNRQSDYWSLVSIMEGHSKDVFFERPDGRRVVASRRMPIRWTDSDQPIESMEDWAGSMKQSRFLAAGVVDTLWSALFGRPPRGSVVDFDAVAQTAAIESMRQQLIDDLLASQFDLARTASLMMASPAGCRTVPKIYEDGSWATQDRSQAERQVDAFAGHAPRAKPCGLGERIAFSLRSMGRKWDGVPGGLLAQVREPNGPSPDRVATGRSGAHALEFNWDYPDRFTSLPAVWLTSIDSPEEQLRHVAYLSHRRQLPDPVLNAANEMRTTGIDDSLWLNRVWWMLND